MAQTTGMEQPKKDLEATGTGWEQYTTELLSIHYDRKGYTYQPVPDRTHGDNGLEGWVDETGEAFQAYSGEKCDTTKKLTAGQKKKITTDLKKLVKYRSFWESVFGPRNVILTKWFLVVPEVPCRTVLEHAGKKAKELRDAGLPFISSDFKGYVVTPARYPEARAVCREPELAQHMIRVREPSSEQIASHDAPEFVRNLRTKLGKLVPVAVDSRIDEQIKQRIRDHLRRENYLSDLDNQFPIHCDELKEFLALQADQTKTDEFLDEDSPKARFRRVKSELKEGLSKMASFASESQKLVVVNGTIAYWLGECSLDFVE